MNPEPALALPDTSPRTHADGNPFRGLVPFNEHDVLLARDGDVDLIQGRLWSSPITVMFAGSGVGKTSLLNAKLLPSFRSIFGAENVAIPAKWASVDPAGAIAAAREQVKGGELSRRGSIIVLDQFEEVFQHFSHPQMLRDTGRQLAQIVQDPQCNVRLLLSIREEFLAELTLFDVFLPGVLTNYYRLNRLTPKQARFIIENTAKEQSRETDSERLGFLVDDLSAVHDSSSGGGLFIDPPYLQIVCRRIWAREKPTQAFLASYARGTASAELEAYCAETLAHFSWSQRKVLSKAIQQLTGPHEAKKPVRVSELADQIKVKRGVISEVLNHLARSDVRILRQWPDQDIYELYHDMYAPMLWKWKLAQERRQAQVTVASTIGLAALTLWLVVWPAFDWAKAFVFLSALDGKGNANVSLDAHRDVSTVLTMRNAFANTAVFRPVGDWLWRSYMTRLEVLSALQEDTDAAFGYRLAGLAADAALDPQRLDEAIGIARSLRGTVSGLGDVTDAVLTDTDVVIGTKSGTIVRWNRQTGRSSTVTTSVPSYGNSSNASSTSLGTEYGVGGDFGPQGSEVLCLTSDGLRAAVATYREGQGPTIAVVETADGRKVMPGFAPDAGSEAPPSLASARPRAAFSRDGSRLVVTFRGNVWVVDVRGDAWSVPRSKDQMFSEAVFVSPDVLAVTSRSDNEPEAVNPCSINEPSAGKQGADDQILLWSYASHKPVTDSVAADKLGLPRTTGLLTDGETGFLARVGGRWQWVSGHGSQPVAVPAPASSSECNWSAVPQVYDPSRHLLISLDPAFRILVSEATTADERRFETIPMSESRSLTPPYIPSIRRIPAGAFAGLSSRGELVTIDDNGATVRIWSLPTSRAYPASPSKEQKALPESRPAQPGLTEPRQLPGVKVVGESVDRRWVAWVDDQRAPDRIQVGAWPEKNEPPNALHTWMAERPMIQVLKSAFVSANGERVVVSSGDKLWYGSRGGTSLVSFAPSAATVVFGPGDDRVTVLEQESLLVTDPSSGKKDWHVPVHGPAFLLHAPDESGVVLYSGFWIHRLTEPPAVSAFVLPDADRWPRITSVFQQFPIASVRPDGGSTARVLINNESKPIDFAKEERRRRGGTRWFSPSRLVPRSIGLCDSANAEAAAASSRQSALCFWELRSGRRLGEPPN